jgi:DNA-binding protein H-NS
MTTSYTELQQEISRLQEQADNMLKAEKNIAIVSIKEMISDLHLTVGDLGFIGTKETKIKAVVPAKYRDTVTNQTWSGRGRKPLWLVNELDTYLIS